MTKDELITIAQEIISYADGSYHLDWCDAYEELTNEEKKLVRDMVYEEIDTCAGCGWHWSINNLEVLSDGESYCWQCERDYQEALEDEQ